MFQVPTGVLSPFEDRGDFVALCGVALGPDSSRAHPHRALVGLDPAEEGRGRASAVCHLRIGVVRLHGEEKKLNASFTLGRMDLIRIIEQSLSFQRRDVKL